MLIHLLKDTSIESVLIFTRTKYGADKLARVLTKAGIGAEAIHGNKTQNARQRALTNFKNHTLRALIATDIAARGIDVDQLSHVINYEFPMFRKLTCTASVVPDVPDMKEWPSLSANQKNCPT